MLKCKSENAKVTYIKLYSVTTGAFLFVVSNGNQNLIYWAWLSTGVIIQSSWPQALYLQFHYYPLLWSWGLVVSLLGLLTMCNFWLDGCCRFRGFSLAPYSCRNVLVFGKVKIALDKCRTPGPLFTMGYLTFADLPCAFVLIGVFVQNISEET